MSIPVAVIIPIHGRVDLLEACLRSITASSAPPAEIIVVDDGNSAEEGKHIAELAAMYGAVSLRNEIAGGAPAARNKGARASACEYIFFADSDITLQPDALESLYNTLSAASGVAFAYGDFYFGSRLMQGRVFDADALRHHNYISTMSLVRRSAFPGFDERIKRFQDWDLWLTIVEQGGVGLYVNKILFHAEPTGTMSRWIPAFMIRNAPLFMWVPRVHRYVRAREIIVQKHRLE